MEVYHNLVKNILENGTLRENRTGVDTIAIFGAHYKINLQEGFPILTTKKVYYKSIIRELLWYLSGQTHIRDLRNHTKIWDAWTSEEKNWEIGKMYGYQWVNWEKHSHNLATGECEVTHINQIQNVIELIKNNPESRRMVVTAWNPSVLNEIALPSCHAFFMFNVIGGKLNCHLTQRSGDVALGIPFNIANYAVLTQMIAQETNLEVGELSHYINDAHIYVNHIDGLKEQLKRRPKSLPQLEISDKPFWDLQFEDFTIKNYQHHPAIKFEVAV
ncbi:MAG: thymidylate synthase [Candidatus Marinimicrobia bacterium]|nr:thymidylate synthase [Candidatus Neomarinimicrobiota bacterium]MBL7022456.1 thymidylate synthase [Candidatus Neomarinimicrobiota bacterium]MBL7108689.1 thymidylate synthase [Candidatus Neomarinimicrobiota bacterium]